MRSFVEAFKFARRVAQQEPLKSFFVGMSSHHVFFACGQSPLFLAVEGEVFPGSSVQTDEQIIGEQNLL